MTTPYAYYNELDKDKAAWLHELARAGVITRGVVDNRSIKDVHPNDLLGFTRVHFFAGIGVWDFALTQAGWPDDPELPVWTGSCPCPSFSAAGKGRGFDDPRHLWPVWYPLIRKRRPPVILGEQVAAAIQHGWLDLVATDLEAEKYAIAPAVLGAHSAGADHIRQRLWFLAYGNERIATGSRAAGSEGSARIQSRRDVDGCGAPVALDNTAGARAERRQEQGAEGDSRHSERLRVPGEGCAVVSLGIPEGAGLQERILLGRTDAGDDGAPEGQGPERASDLFDLGDTTQRGLGMHRGAPGNTGHPALSDATGFVAEPDGSCAARLGGDSGTGAAEGRLRGGLADSRGTVGLEDADGAGSSPEQDRGQNQRARSNDSVGARITPGLMAGPCGDVGHSGGIDHAHASLGPVGGPVERVAGFWDSADFVYCRDKGGPRWRAVEPGTFPVVDGAPSRVGRLRGFGDAIPAPTAVEFIAASIEVLRDMEVLP